MPEKIILAVDDMPDNLIQLESLLKDYFDIRLAQSARMALEFLERVRVDLILLDIEMPEMHGFVFLRKFLSSNEKNKGVPVVFVTSHAEVDSFKEAINAGARDYLLKPIKPDLLYQKIDAIIGMPKYKINSIEGKLVRLKEAAAVMDGDQAKSLTEELVKLAELAHTKVPDICVRMEEIEKLIAALKYRDGIEKIEKLIDYLSLFSNYSE